MVRAALVEALAHDYEALLDAHYPEPVEHCAVCLWEARCVARRRKDDHLSFIAGSGRVHRQELTAQGHPTLTSAATMAVPVPFKPSRGARETYDRLGDQARVQHQQRTEHRPVFERLPVAAGEGLTRLPEPSRGDVFLDLEGARFAREDGREFLFGVYEHSGYRAWWAMTDAEEKARIRRRDGPDHGRMARRPRHARVSLQPLRAHRVQEAGGPARDARRGARSAAPLRTLRRSLPSRPAGGAVRRGELFDQAARAVLPATSGG